MEDQPINLKLALYASPNMLPCVVTAQCNHYFLSPQRGRTLIRAAVILHQAAHEVQRRLQQIMICGLFAKEIS